MDWKDLKYYYKLKILGIGKQFGIIYRQILEGKENIVITFVVVYLYIMENRLNFIDIYFIFLFFIDYNPKLLYLLSFNNRPIPMWQSK